MARATKTKKEPDMATFDDPLAELNLTPTAEPKSKKKDEHVYIDSSDLEAACKDIIKAKKMEKDAKATKEKAEAEILPWAETNRLEESVKKGESVSTIVLNKIIRISTQNRYSTIDAEHKALLAEVFGSDLNDFVETVNSINLKAEFTKDKNKLTELIKAMGGPEKFKEFFDISQSIILKPNFHTKYSTDKKFQAKVSGLIDDGVIRRTKATVVPV